MLGRRSWSRELLHAQQLHSSIFRTRRCFVLRRHHQVSVLRCTALFDWLQDIGEFSVSDGQGVLESCQARRLSVSQARRSSRIILRPGNIPRVSPRPAVFEVEAVGCLFGKLRDSRRRLEQIQRSRCSRVESDIPSSDTVPYTHFRRGSSSIPETVRCIACETAPMQFGFPKSVASDGADALS